MRRLVPGLLAFLVLTGLVLVLPVVSRPGPAAVPVSASADQVELGSVTEPSAAADVAEGTTVPVAGAPDTAPVLTVTRTDVPEFSLVGVTWAFDPAVVDTVAQVRVQDAAGAWGPWTQVDVEDGLRSPEAGSADAMRGGTAPLWTGPSTAVQVEVVTRSGAQPTDVRLDLIDPGSSAADETLGEPEITSTANAAVTMPPIYRRSQWGADERLRKGAPQFAPQVNAVTIHHTAGSNNYAAADVPAILRGIYAYHTGTMGWADIGYNVLVDKYGRLWEGRYGGVASTVIGAHASGFNTGTVGVSMIGNYDVVDTTPAMIDATVAYLTWKTSLHGINPRGSTTVAGRVLPTIFAHRDVGQTACPGRYGYAKLPTIRQRVGGAVMDVWKIDQRYDSDAGLRALLGPVVTGPTMVGAGTGGYAHYANGSLYYSPATGVRMVPNGVIRDKWSSMSWERGSLGYPTADAARTPDGAGWYGHFQGGSVYWSAATGAHTISGAIRDRWAALGWQTSPLGYPAADQAVTPDGNAQYLHFQRGSMYWSPATGARSVSGAVKDAWAAQGWERGSMGLPIGDVGTTSDARAQFGHFQGGSIYVVDGTTRLLPPVIVDAWRRSGWERGDLGYPTSALVAAAGGGGAQLAFEHGTVHVVDGKGFALHGPVEDAFLAAGGVGGTLGAPLTDVGTTPDGGAEFAHFANGSVYAVGGTARVLPPAFVAAWKAAGWERGALGYPTSAVTAVPGGQAMSFERGSIHVNAAGTAFPLDGAVEDAYAAAGGSAGALGFPTTPTRATPDGRGRYAHFAAGSVYWTPTTGARIVSGPIKDQWAATGWERGLGYPTTDVTRTPDGRGSFAHFEKGSVYWTPATGARTVSGPIKDQWAATGWERGLGYPTTSVTATPDRIGQYVHFEKGSIYWTAATGARSVSRPIRDAWAATGWERGLGYPTTSVTATPDGIGTYVHFQKGSIYSTTAYGTHALREPFKSAWAGTGWERGRLGYPTRSAYAVSGGTRMDFQRGWITVSTSTGQATVTYR